MRAKVAFWAVFLVLSCVGAAVTEWQIPELGAWAVLAGVGEAYALEAALGLICMAARS